MATRDEVNKAVQTTLQNGTGKSVFLMEILEDTPALPYSILYPQIGGEDKGGFQDEQERDFNFQVTSVGKDPRQSAWMSSKVEAVMTSRDGGGNYVHPILLTGHDILWRRVVFLGPLGGSGKTLFQAADIYALRIARS